MFGRKTAVVLGAGASCCYEDGGSNIPMQANIVGRLFFGGHTGSGVGFPSFNSPSGPKHSFQLGQYLREKFDIPEQPSSELGKIDFWTILQARGYNLESLYAELEQSLSGDGEWLLEQFKAILRTAVLEPTIDREMSRVCRYHRMLCEWLEPGDYIINFNWDSLMADALLYYSHFWFPMTGFGYSPVNPLVRPCQKALPVDSLVDLYHIHGSVVLYEMDNPQESNTRSLLYLGPKQYDQLMAFMALEGMDRLEPGSHSFPAKPENEEAGERLLALSHILLKGKWYRPIFVSPSRAKHEYQHWYFRGLKRFIHSRLPMMEAIIIAGYSFPEADYQHLAGIFISDIIPERASIQVINPSNGNKFFRERVKRVFPSQERVDFSVNDFKEYCCALGPVSEVAGGSG